MKRTTTALVGAGAVSFLFTPVVTSSPAVAFETGAIGGAVIGAGLAYLIGGDKSFLLKGAIVGGISGLASAELVEAVKGTKA